VRRSPCIQSPDPLSDRQSSLLRNGLVPKSTRDATPRMNVFLLCSEVSIGCWWHTTWVKVTGEGVGSCLRYFFLLQWLGRSPVWTRAKTRISGVTLELFVWTFPPGSRILGD